jgi:hypothetical protein
MTDTERAYLAAAVDGEGCITFKTRTSLKQPWLFDVRVYITNTNKAWLEQLQAIIGFGGICRNGNPKPHSKQGWRYYIDGKKGQDFLRQIFDYLMIKQDQAYLAIYHTPNGSGKSLTEVGRQKRTELFLKMKALNKRGV